MKLKSLASALLAVFLFVVPAIGYPPQYTTASVLIENDIEFETSAPNITGYAGITQIPRYDHLTMAAQKLLIQVIFNRHVPYTGIKRPASVWSNWHNKFVLFPNSPSYGHTIKQHINFNGENYTYRLPTVLGLKFDAVCGIFGGVAFDFGFGWYEKWTMRANSVFQFRFGDPKSSMRINESRQNADQANNTHPNAVFRPHGGVGGGISRFPLGAQIGAAILFGLLAVFFYVRIIHLVWISDWRDGPGGWVVLRNASMGLIMLGCSITMLP